MVAVVNGHIYNELHCPYFDMRVLTYEPGYGVVHKPMSSRVGLGDSTPESLTKLLHSGYTNIREEQI